MKSYEYSSIFTPQEFQNFARDIIQIKENKFIESFAEGKDGGIDGRFIDQEGNITILQVKRYKNMNVTILNTMKEEKWIYSLKMESAWIDIFLCYLKI